MRLTNICLVFLSLLVQKTALSQDYIVPANYKLESREDYTKYEKDIIDAAKWLVATPFNEQQEKRKEVSTFVVKWINGSPTVNVEINPTIMDFEKKNPGMLVLYMASSAKYVLENNYSKDMRAKHKAAIHDMMGVYQKGKAIEKDKKMEKLIESDGKGKMDEWLEKNMKIEGQ